MTVEHMALVFAAEGLSANEKVLLLAGANLCTQKGTFSAGRERLVSMTGLPRSTLTRTREKLELKGLWAKRRRNNGGESLPNAYRIDVAKLAALCPSEPPEHDDDVFAALFDADDENASDQQIAHCGPGGGLRLVHPLVSAENASNQQIAHIGSSGLTPPDQQIAHCGPHKEEEDLNTPPPTPSIEDGRAFVEELPPAILSRISELNRARLAKLTAVALAVGHDRDALRWFLIADLDGVRSLYAVMKRRLEIDLPSEPLPPRTRPKPAEPSEPQATQFAAASSQVREAVMAEVRSKHASTVRSIKLDFNPLPHSPVEPR